MNTISLICIIIGIAVLALFGILGFVLAHSVAGSVTISSLLSLNPVGVYVVFVGGFFVIGLLICAGLVMNGLIYDKLDKLEKLYRREKKKRRPPQED